MRKIHKNATSAKKKAAGGQRSPVTHGSQPSTGALGAILCEKEALSRAYGYRKPIPMRVNLDKIGFWPGNRCNNGIFSWHVHDLAMEMMAKKVRIDRCQLMEVMEIPPELLDEFKFANQEMCENDPLMPKFSPEMCYVTASKTHVLHALKLGQEGGRKLFNLKYGSVIEWKPDDHEAAECMRSGPVCVVYGADIFKDKDAVEALTTTANAHELTTCAC